MVFQIFSPPETGVNWLENKLGDINDALEWDCTRYFCGVGTFTLVIPRNSPFAEVIQPNTFLVCDGEGYIVRNILTENDRIKLTGYDLNGILADRVTLFSQNGTDGNKDAVSGTTEFVAKHFVRKNLAECDDEKRIIPRFEVAENKGRGIADDHDLRGVERVDEVVSDILAAAEMGWRVSLRNIENGGGLPLMVFDVQERVDRTAGQYDNSRVIFSFGMGNITQMQRETGVTADKNVFYCELEDGVIQSYPTAPAEGEDKRAAGFERREEYLSLGCSLDVMERHAEHEIADRYRPTDSLTITAGNPLEYGTVYNVGDIVTVYDRERKVQLDSVISAAEIKQTATEYTVKITLGESKPKLLDSYAKKSGATARTVQRNGGGTAGNYTTRIDFRAGGFDLYYSGSGGTVKNEFSVKEDSSGRVTELYNKTAERKVVVNYE